MNGDSIYNTKHNCRLLHQNWQVTHYTFRALNRNIGTDGLMQTEYFVVKGGEVAPHPRGLDADHIYSELKQVKSIGIVSTFSI